jgi:fatty-acyl-CoA synthase
MHYPLTPIDQLSQEEQATLKARQGIELAFNGETKVVGQDGQEVAWNGEELGEIVTRGNVVMKGYYKDEEQTKAAMKDGWFHTGDLAVTHPDGYIEIRDRAKDIIISGGENISSTEIEGVLYKHPAVLETAVIAIPDDRWGEVPLAIIVLKPESTVTESEIIAFCRANMAHFKAPKAVKFVGELPKTATGKLQKFRLRKMYWDSEKRVN